MITKEQKKRADEGFFCNEEEVIHHIVRCPDFHDSGWWRDGINEEHLTHPINYQGRYHTINRPGLNESELAEYYLVKSLEVCAKNARAVIRGLERIKETKKIIGKEFSLIELLTDNTDDGRDCVKALKELKRVLDTWEDEILDE